MPSSALPAALANRLRYRHLMLLQQLWQACTAVVRSDWQQQHWDATTPEAGSALEGACADFLAQQRRWRERDIVALQRLPLRERVERYRALGPLTFETTVGRTGT